MCLQKVAWQPKDRSSQQPKSNHHLFQVRQKAIHCSKFPTSLSRSGNSAKYLSQEIKLADLSPGQQIVTPHRWHCLPVLCLQRFYGSQDGHSWGTLDGPRLNCFILCLPLVFTRLTHLVQNTSHSNNYISQTFYSIQSFWYFCIRWVQEIPQGRNQSHVAALVWDLFAWQSCQRTWENSAASMSKNLECSDRRSQNGSVRGSDPALTWTWNFLSRSWDQIFSSCLLFKSHLHFFVLII